MNKFYSENAVEWGKAARKRWARTVDAALSKCWHQLRESGEEPTKGLKIKRANRYAANETSTDFVTLGAPTIGTGMGQERANEFITVAASKPAARSTSDTVIANSICGINMTKKPTSRNANCEKNSLRHWQRLIGLPHE